MRCVQMMVRPFWCPSWWMDTKRPKKAKQQQGPWPDTVDTEIVGVWVDDAVARHHEQQHHRGVCRDDIHDCRRDDMAAHSDENEYLVSSWARPTTRRC